MCGEPDRHQRRRLRAIGTAKSPWPTTETESKPFAAGVGKELVKRLLTKPRPIHSGQARTIGVMSVVLQVELTASTRSSYNTHAREARRKVTCRRSRTTTRRDPSRAHLVYLMSQPRVSFVSRDTTVS